MILRPVQAALTISLLLLGGCNGPWLAIPGGAISGPPGDLAEANIPAEGGVITLETRPSDPYSVYVNAVAIDGVLHIDPTADRGWYQHIALDRQVRIRLPEGEAVYPALAQPVTDPAIKARFEADRIVLQLVPRP